MTQNLAHNLTTTAQRHPDRPALRVANDAITYAEFDDATARVAGLLRAHGVGPGDRVGIMLPNVAAFPIVYYGVLRAGAVVVPMNVLLKRREVGFYLTDSSAKLAFTWHECAEAARAGAGDAGCECVVVEPGPFEDLLAATAATEEITDRAASDTAYCSTPRVRQAARREPS
jgi:long-chain acyl-CoA synthetase